MKTFNYNIKHKNISKDIDITLFRNENNILIQIFCGKGKDTLKSITTQITGSLPQAICIGTTTDGEIKNSKVYINHTIVSISIFNSCDIQSGYTDNTDSYINGRELAKQLIKKNTKLIIAFTDGTTTNGEKFLKGIETINNNIIVAGAMAGDNGMFTQTYISLGDKILKSGAVGISLNSNSLFVNNYYAFNWNPIGISHTINRVKENRVYEIDGISPVEFYSKYLGDDVANSLPITGIEFPFILEQDSISMARAIIKKHDDGSLSFAGNLKEGDEIKLGFANVKGIINNPNLLIERFCNMPVETFFLYSCMARRRYMPNFIDIEIEPFSKIAPVSGFFSYGEFYHYNNTNKLFNQTLTAISLSESDNLNRTIKCKEKMQTKGDKNTKTIQALTHLIEQSAQDLRDEASELKKQKEYSQKLLREQKIFIRQTIHETMTPLAAIMSNVELFELKEGRNVYLKNINVSIKSIVSIYDDLSYLIKKNQISYPKYNIELKDYLRSRIDFFLEVASISNIDIQLITHIKEAYIYFNKTKLQRIIDNNITNAIKYTINAQKIKVILEENKESYIVSFLSKSVHINDTKKVFEAYYTEKHTKNGFGIGLNLVKQICDEENIKIVLSVKPEFTTFTYYIEKKGNP